MECKVAISKIHDYLDGELPQDEINKLKTHLGSCSACRQRFEQLEKTDAAVMLALSAAAPTANYDASSSRQLTERIMQQLPKHQSKQRNGFVRFIYRYPGITAAALFLLVVIGSFLASWQGDTMLVISGDDLQQLVIEGNTVIVPEGVHVAGNLTIENGSIEVLGEVEGNVTVIDGNMVLASTGHIAGQSRTIDQALDWFWYKIMSAFDGNSR